MDSTTIFFDFLFAIGAILSAGFLAYGGWLCRLNEKPESAHEIARTGQGATEVSPSPSVDFSSSVALPLVLVVLVLSGESVARFLA